MIGDTPQPGETPRSEGDPWSFGDPDAFWWRGETERPGAEPPNGRQRHPRRRAPQHQAQSATGATGGTGTLLPPGHDRVRAGEAAAAHAAATRDVEEHLLDPDPFRSGRLEQIESLSIEVVAAPADPPTAVTPPAGETPAGTTATAEPPVVERDHDQADPRRYDPLRPPAGYQSKIVPGTVAADDQTATARVADALTTNVQTPADQTRADQSSADQSSADQSSAEPAPAERTATAPAAVEQTAVEQTAAEQTAVEQTAVDEPVRSEPDVMILPEPNARNRPTVALDRGPVPGQPVSSGPMPGFTRPTEPLPRPTGQPYTDARLEKLENSPFWQDRPDDAIGLPPLRPAHTAVRTHRSRRPARRLPLSAHVSLVVLGLIAAFFGWVSAEPFWLAVGHGDRGTATTTACVGSGITQRCVGQFAAADGRFTVSRITLLGVALDGRTAGSVAPARMISRDSRQAYLGDTGTLLHLRWILGFALVLVCGYAVAGVTRARRLETARARRVATLLSMAGPCALLAGFLIAAY